VATSSFAAHEFSFAFFALATASLLARRLTTESAEEPLSLFSRFLRVTGTYSYSIYLVHQPIIVAVTETSKRLFPALENNPWGTFFAGLSSWLIVFPVAALLYYSVEKPSISLGKRWLKALSRRWSHDPSGRWRVPQMFPPNKRSKAMW
jgi:peptidoglycan/LPS O-acetylase OafA/YrhL